MEKASASADPKKTTPVGSPRTGVLPSPWPSLPTTQAAADRLVRALTLTAPPATPAPELTAKSVRALLLRRLEQGRVTAGWPAIVGWFQGELDRAAAEKRGAQILWGVYHDSGGQLRAFGRLVGQDGLRGLHGHGVEQFAADGHWRGLPAAGQRGDSADLTRYLERGGRAARERLGARQHKNNHTAWRYGYLAEVMDLLTSARAGASRLLPCDMPVALKARISGLTMNTRMRLRELHCGLALSRALHAARVAAPRRVATLWGQEHVLPAGVPRFLPAGTRVMSVQVFGFRPGPHGLEQQLGRGLKLTHPLLLPLDEQASRLVLLLPGPTLGLRLERRRALLDQPVPLAARGVVTARSRLGGVLRLGGRTHRVPGPGSRAAPPRVKLPPGSHAFVYSVKGELYGGAVQIPADSRVELDLDSRAMEAQSTIFFHSPSGPGPGK